MMLFFNKIKKYLIGGAILVAIAFGSWKYYTYTQNQIQVYRTNAALAEQNHQQAETALKEVQASIEKMRTEFEVTQKKFQDASKRVEILEQKLSEHDLGFLAESKPSLVEIIIDKATQDVLRCFEIESGSPLTQEEIDATKPSQINNSCPDIANPNYRP